MRIEDILKETQSEVYKKLRPKKERKKKVKKEKLNEKDIKELMGSRSYKRCSGAIRQVR